MSTKSKVTNDEEYRPAVPWPEWSDVELNSEKWDSPKNGTDGRFLDPDQRLTPPSIEPHDWKRAGPLLNNLSINPVVFTPSNEYPDFVKNNVHILHSQFVRWFVSTMLNLQYVGRDGLHIDGESTNLPWRGWTYVYSLNKTGGSAPVVNPNGKYVVRLFFMGIWRRLIVDDMIPVDENDLPLLPRTERDSDLWPMLLSKALMKLAAFSWTSQREISDFYPVSCFTGWICLPLDAKSLSPGNKWDLLTSYTADHKAPSNDEKRIPNQVVLFANLSSAEEEEFSVPDLTPRSYSHPVYIEKLRDITVESTQMRWKLHRYFDWVSSRGIKSGSKNPPGESARSLKSTSPLTPRVENDLGTREMTVWKDFGKIAPYLDKILLFYRSSAFEYSARVSDALTIRPRVKSQTTSSKDDKKSPTTSFQSSLNWSQDSVLYLLLDSIYAKSVLIEFCSTPASARPYLIVERHNILKRSDEDATALIKTLSTGATLFESDPGRHLYRILFRSGCSYSLRIISDTIFHLGDRGRMLELMTTEADRVDAIARSISDGINAAFKQFGNPSTYGKGLRTFYASYTPSEIPAFKIPESLHGLVMAELHELIKASFPATEAAAVSRSVKVFFVASSPSKSASSPPHTQAENAAIRIQSFFRMSLIKQYKNLHNPSHSGHSAIVEGLRKLADLLSLHSSKDSLVSPHSFTRRLINGSSKFSSSGSIYGCIDDLDKVLNVTVWSGVIRSVIPGSWVPVLRLVLNAPSPGSTVLAGIDFSSIGLPRRVIRVVNNATNREMKRFSNGKLSVVNCPHVGLGYTLIAYGWTNGGLKSKDIDWRVSVTTVKYRPTFVQLLGSKPPILSTKELTTGYIPNPSNLIGKWIAKVSVVCSPLTFRLSASYTGAETEIIIRDKYGVVLCRVSGGQNLVLPVVYQPLAKNNEEEHQSVEYFVQAYVAKDSWPLTRAEWTAAIDAKSKGPRASAVSLRRGAGGFKRPSCKLQVVVDAGSKFEIEEDRRREVEIEGLKKLWEDSEPGRLFRGIKLREEFLGPADHNSVVSMVSDRRESSTRTLKPPASICRFITPCSTAMKEFRISEAAETRLLKTEYDEEMLRNERAIKRLDFSESQAAHECEEAALMVEQRDRYSSLYNSYANKSVDWKILWEFGNRKRDDYVTELKTTISSNVTGRRKNGNNRI